MSELTEITDQIHALKQAHAILKNRYEQSDFHKKREKSPHSPVQPSPQDKDVLHLLTAIQQLDKLVKELQDEQFRLLKSEEA